MLISRKMPHTAAFFYLMSYKLGACVKGRCMAKGRFRRQIVQVVSAGALLCACAPALAQNLPYECGTFENNYGPFDYRTAKAQLHVVEQYHFNARTESLAGGQTGTVGADISYTLRAYPNHHRALLSMIRLGQREKRDKPDGASHTVRCFLTRAEVFRPDDYMVKMLTGIYLMNKGSQKEAVEKFEAAERLESGDANLQYNLGLAYFRLGRFDEALAHAHKAYGMGFTLPGLRGLLKREGKWREPERKAAVEESAAEGR